MATVPLCSSCISGSIHSGTPTGREDVIHGLQTYIATPEDITPKAIVIMIPDAFGWKMVNNRLLCDAYAKKGGYLVYLPDFMNGAALPAEFLELDAQLNAKAAWSPSKLPLYLKMSYAALPQLIHLRPNLCRPRIIAFLQALRTSPPPFALFGGVNTELKIGVAGFCWGGSFTIGLTHDEEAYKAVRYTFEMPQTEDVGRTGKALIDCAFTAHPALIKTPSDLEKVKIPLSVCIGVEDEWMKGSDVAVMKKVLDEKNREEDGNRHECVLLEGAKHGFAVRSWEGDAVQMVFADVAEKQALAWFAEWLG